MFAQTGYTQEIRAYGAEPGFSSGFTSPIGSQAPVRVRCLRPRPRPGPVPPATARSLAWSGSLTRSLVPEWDSAHLGPYGSMDPFYGIMCPMWARRSSCGSREPYVILFVPMALSQSMSTPSSLCFFSDVSLNLTLGMGLLKETIAGSGGWATLSVLVLPISL